MSDNMGKDLATSDPFMQIGLTIAKVGKMIQDQEVPQSVKDAYEALKAHASSGSADIQKAYETVKKHISDAVSQPVKGEELLTQKQGPELPLAGTAPTPSSTKSSQPGTISQKDFADGLRSKIPALKDFTDSQIVNKIIQLRPDLEDKIESPIMGDQMAGNAQSRLEAESASPSYISPDFWNKHPNMKQFMLGATGTLPGVGAMGGAVLAGPETMGLGSIPAAMGGAGVGQGARDFINMLAGLDQNSPTQKGLNIGMEAGLAGITPGITEALLHPISTARGVAGTVSDMQSAMIPRGLRRYLHPDFLDNFARGGGSRAIDPMIRPPSQSWSAPEKSTIDRLEELISGQKSGPGISESAQAMKDAPETQITKTIAQAKRELPRFKVNGDGTFTNMSTGEVLDKAGKPVVDSSISPNVDKFTSRLGELITKAKSAPLSTDELAETRDLVKQLNLDNYTKVMKQIGMTPIVKKEGLSNITRHLGPFLK